MNISGNTILITGGATGIGLAMAEKFLQENNTVIVCGRRTECLDEAKAKFPALHILQIDIADKEDRLNLFNEVMAFFPSLNVLINNAGIQREIDFTSVGNELFAHESEIETNLTAPMHLSALFMEHLMLQPAASIINVSSGLAFSPLAIMPIYCATKAALHSFSISLRHQLRNTSVKVFELIPPIVDTDLDKGARDKRGHTDKGLHPNVVADALITSMKEDNYEIAVGYSATLMEKREAACGFMNK